MTCSKIRAVEHVIYIYTVAKMREFCKNKVLNVVNVELKQSKFNLLPHGVTQCFTYADDGDDLQTGVEDGWVQYLSVPM